jgi:hypothetical protein
MKKFFIVTVALTQFVVNGMRNDSVNDSVVDGSRDCFYYCTKLLDKYDWPSNNVSPDLDIFNTEEWATKHAPSDRELDVFDIVD